MALNWMPGFVNAWSGYYGNHQLVSVMVRFVHLSAIALGGGAALLTDYRVLRTRNAGVRERKLLLEFLDKIHGYVIPWLAVVAATGALMTAADIPTFLVSKVYWTKISLVVLLLANGIALLRAERHMLKTGIDAGFQRLVVVSTISIVLWQMILFAGTFLTVAA
jgi:hypothetical protein